jgi:hypothetical protein
MRSHTARLYAASVTLVVFFVVWATVAARPWTSAAPAKPEPDPRLAALDRWEHRLQREAVAVRRTVNRRWAVYRRRLKAREAQIAAARRRHARQLAAAAAARARIAAQQTAVAQPVARPAGPAPAAPAPAAGPPPVRIVTLPAATPPAATSTSSAP